MQFFVFFRLIDVFGIGVVVLWIRHIFKLLVPLCWDQERLPPLYPYQQNKAQASVWLWILLILVIIVTWTSEAMTWALIWCRRPNNTSSNAPLPSIVLPVQHPLGATTIHIEKLHYSRRPAGSIWLWANGWWKGAAVRACLRLFEVGVGGWWYISLNVIPQTLQTSRAYDTFSSSAITILCPTVWHEDVLSLS